MKSKLLALFLLLPVFGFGQTYNFSTIVKFQNNSQKGPRNPNPLIIDGAGNLYGTSVYGGTYGVGSVFKVTPKNVLSILYSFQNSTDGGNPYGPLVRDSSGNLYGETFSGGTYNYGTIFTVTPGGKESVLHNFSQEISVSGGSGLVMDSSGNLYGYDTAINGSVFEVTTAGEYKTLYTFCQLSGCTDGYSPFYRPTVKSNGVIYGITEYGGDSSCSAGGCGVVFELDTSGNETVLHAFTGGTDGASPSSNLAQDSAGNLYGTTGFGGTGKSGVMFKLDSSNNYSIFYNFCSQTNCADGADPGGYLHISSGNIFGINQGNGQQPEPYGDIFKITTSGAESVLFTAAGPAKLGSGLVTDKSGNLYGTTWDGGPAHTGTVYKLTKN
ncbi:MAG TPA: choice-of-anchor tandem repeat GloVer-containing protein [Candidatus Sulfotelmatobacter sp.]|nr:choice-of-anchor tandem repeat GloVer-containing protein [Candidatus Sulfotelmatobacter sp.]